MGVPIRLHWSFPLLLVLLAIPVGGHFLVAPFLESLVWIGALFACVVVHELSHCFVARRRGFAGARRRPFAHRRRIADLRVARRAGR